MSSEAKCKCGFKSEDIDVFDKHIRQCKNTDWMVYA